MSLTTPTGDGPSTKATATDDLIIDLRDHVLAQRASDDLIIDLRDHVVAAGKHGLARPETDDKPKSGRPGDLPEGCELVVLEEEDERWEKAERFVYETYCEMQYCRPSERRRVEELQRWNERSNFHVVFDEEENVIGTSRHIWGRFDELPVGQFERTDHVDLDPVSELSSLAVAPTARGLGTVVHLCRSVFVEAWKGGANALMFLIDDWMVKLLADTYVLPIRFVGEPHFHMGGDVAPTSMTFTGRTFLETARQNPHYWRWMTEAFEPQQVVDWELPIVLVDEPEPTHEVLDLRDGVPMPHAEADDTSDVQA
jgi:hypothetical protein